MIRPPSPYLPFIRNSRSFLRLAEAALARFDETLDAADIFTAAIFLRMGIEGRMWEYIEANLGSSDAPEHKALLLKIEKKHAVSKLVEDLRRAVPMSAKAVQLSVTVDGETGPASVFDYTPVTSDLGRLHGQLGELLHYNYFIRNPLWNRDFVSRPHPQRAAVRPGSIETLRDAREFLRTCVLALKSITRGLLLTHPEIQRVVGELAGSAAATSEGLAPAAIE